ncbi:universal stress protein [Cryptosporangium aurantiacum]|uniref:Nucleotide-binding universal stress protein, UspA family n=1 Tax=Cryptosporangium aurantiacum TaxID=134849 RepID=A0A1M7TZ25_9ACTN|nr:universal stress protein [Cryptosporangium aurantiacum]SHN75964.1 Nucleotide-binding universal stress protein, UspA family [Cryptosporangium aurantiacum]
MVTGEKVVLVGTDGSAQSDRAVEWAAAEAVRRGRPLRIVHGFIWPLLHVSTAPVPGIEGSGLRAAAEELLAAAAERARTVAPDLPVSTGLRVGAPVPALLAEVGSAELLVIGSRRLDPVTGLIVGSVGVELAATAPCPIVVVNDSTAASGTPSRIVVGIDGFDHEHGTAQAAAVLDFAFVAAEQRGAKLAVVHAIGRAGHAGAEQAAISSVVTEWADKHPGVSVESVTERSSPANALLTHAAGADLLVVGAHGWGGLAGMLHGSVSRQALWRAPCPVAVVRADTRADTPDAAPHDAGAHDAAAHDDGAHDAGPHDAGGPSS